MTLNEGQKATLKSVMLDALGSAASDLDDASCAALMTSHPVFAKYADKLENIPETDTDIPYR